MFGKRTRVVTMIAAAAGIPYVWFNESISGPVRGTLSSWKNTFSSSGTENGLGRLGATNLGGQAFPATNHRLADVLRFDITPRWITQQWSRVSTVPGEMGLIGFRVPLVTGTHGDDITGSLTYYFDQNRKLQRLTLRGETGDERPLVAIAAQFGLQPEPSLSTGMLLSRWNGRPISLLRVTPAPVIRVDSPNSRYHIDLELNDARSPFGLSREVMQSLQHDANVQRWGDR